MVIVVAAADKKPALLKGAKKSEAMLRGNLKNTSKGIHQRASLVKKATIGKVVALMMVEDMF